MHTEEVNADEELQAPRAPPSERVLVLRVLLCATGWRAETQLRHRQYKSEQVPAIDIKSNTITAQDSRRSQDTLPGSLRLLRSLKFISQPQLQCFANSFAFVCVCVNQQQQQLKMCMAKEKLVTKSGVAASNGKSESAKRNWTTMFTKVIKRTFLSPSSPQLLIDPLSGVN